MSWIESLKKLNKENRNQLRAALESGEGKSIRLLNKIRKEKTATEIYLMENVLRAYKSPTSTELSEPFPTKAQTRENYYRLDPVPFEKSLGIASLFIKEHQAKAKEYFQRINKINLLIIQKNFLDASIELKEIYQDLGYSHLLLRKVVLIKSLYQDEKGLDHIESLLKEFGLDRNNTVISSIVHAFKEEQDYLIIKRSVMSRPDRGKVNKFSRDISRLPFHPFAKDTEDLSELIQSCTQSSLIDLVVILKINAIKFPIINSFVPLECFFNEIDESFVDIDSIANLYDVDDSESDHTFLKHSSAWLEIDDIVRYRCLHDHFFDFPESNYLSINDSVLEVIKGWVGDLSLMELNAVGSMGFHGFKTLNRIERAGLISNSSLFNYCIYKEKGFCKIGESDLISLMGKTKDLSKTVIPEYLENLAVLAETELSKLIIYLLIAKKSRNEIQDHKLRNILQSYVKKEYHGDLIEFVSELSKKSSAIAVYFYETATEDFIAKLFHLISETEQITETRARLHHWMGDLTDESIYKDRARTILIDHKINKIRNEIDDNRIYVDVARFVEWVNDETMRDFSPLFTNMAFRNDSKETEYPQLINMIEICYQSFCSNNIFGIASYLGRRIRHGTFKGHTYSKVATIAKNEKYEHLLQRHNVSAIWTKWLNQFEEKIDFIISEKLQIESDNKKQGLIKPNSKEQRKVDVLLTGSEYLVKKFLESESYSALPLIITEICWRLAEVDLKTINTYLKGQKNHLLNLSLLNELRQATDVDGLDLSNEFIREVTHTLDDNLKTICNWFKRPISASPKVSLQLLYKAVLTEVRSTFPEFVTDIEHDPDSDIEVIGSVYLLIYDALYVIVFNAAKHGKSAGNLDLSFKFLFDETTAKKQLYISLSSEIRDEDLEESVSQRLKVDPDDDFNDAQICENRSGIRKLFHLQAINKDFKINTIDCRDRRVFISFTIDLVA